jgi:FtsZ-binding cell division protein ZapB
MKKQQIGAVALTTVLSVGAFIGAAQADQTLDNILKEGQAMTTAGVQSQKRIDKLQEETSDLYQEFKAVNKEIEGLRVYNRQLQKQIDNQQKVLSDLSRSIDQVTVRERQMQPLILRMLDSLEQFVALDAPFLQEERQERIAQLWSVQDRADVSVAEKFRQVLEAYKIEAEYGRNSLVYEDTLNIGGVDKQVNMLMVGRVALVYQTKDKALTGVWDQENRTFVELEPGKYANAVANAIKVADGGVPEMMRLPIAAPEAVQ